MFKTERISLDSSLETQRISWLVNCIGRTTGVFETKLLDEHFVQFSKNCTVFDTQLIQQTLKRR